MADNPYLPRDELAKFLPSDRAIAAFEENFRRTGENSSAASDAQGTADAAVAATADLKLATYVTLSTDAILQNERVLTPGNRIDFTDGGPGGNLEIAVVTDGIVFETGAQTLTDKKLDQLRTTQTATPSATARSHSVPVDINGTTYYLMLSATP